MCPSSPSSKPIMSGVQKNPSNTDPAGWWIEATLRVDTSRIIRIANEFRNLEDCCFSQIGFTCTIVLV
jgi:hypothetical protein